MLKNKKENQLLYIGAGIFFCTCVIDSILSYFDIDLSHGTDKFGDFDNIFSIIIFALVIAPVFEELFFRGVFTKKKIYNYFFYAGSAVMVFITNNYYLLIIPIIIFALHFWKYNIWYIYILNSLLFALIHYQISDFVHPYSVIPVFFQFSIGLILIWITINYSLKGAMIFHFLFNFLIIAPVILVLQFPDKQNNTLTHNENIFKWEKTEIIGKSKILYTHKKVTAE